MPPQQQKQHKRIAKRQVPFKVLRHPLPTLTTHHFPSTFLQSPVMHTHGEGLNCVCAVAVCSLLSPFFSSPAFPFYLCASVWILWFDPASYLLHTSAIPQRRRCSADDKVCQLSARSRCHAHSRPAAHLVGCLPTRQYISSATLLNKFSCTALKTGAPQYAMIFTDVQRVRWVVRGAVGGMQWAAA